MEKLIRTLKKYKKDIVKGGIYLFFLSVFIRFYLVAAIKNYLIGGTTIRSIIENVEFLSAPYITLCFNPYFKPSLLKKYGLFWPVNYVDIKNVQANVSSKWELYQHLSFELDKDFEIQINYEKVEIKQD